MEIFWCKILRISTWSVIWNCLYFIQIQIKIIFRFFLCLVCFRAILIALKQGFSFASVNLRLSIFAGNFVAHILNSNSLAIAILHRIRSHDFVRLVSLSVVRFKPSCYYTFCCCNYSSCVFSQSVPVCDICLSPMEKHICLDSSWKMYYFAERNHYFYLNSLWNC